MRWRSMASRRFSSAASIASVAVDLQVADGLFLGDAIRLDLALLGDAGGLDQLLG